MLVETEVSPKPIYLWLLVIKKVYGNVKCQAFPQKKYLKKRINTLNETIKEFEEIQPKKKQIGTRKYTPENVLTIQFIYHLVKEKGLTLQGAKKQLRLKTKENPKEEILAKLENIKAALKLLREKL